MAGLSLSMHGCHGLLRSRNLRELEALAAPSASWGSLACLNEIRWGPLKARMARVGFMRIQGLLVGSLILICLNKIKVTRGMNESLQ